MAIRGGYAPPSVYTESIFESPTPQNTVTGRVPLFIGTGRETVVVNGLTLVRGSSATADQQMVEEDLTGRAVLSVNPNGTYVLGDFDGSVNKVQTKLFPIVTGDGTGTVAVSTSSLSATVNGEPVVILAVDGANGIVTLSVAPKLNDEVYLSYFFNRTDSLVSDEDMSAQVSDEPSIIRNQTASSFDYLFVAQTDETLILSVDEVSYVISLPTINTGARATNLANVVTAINSSGAGSLEAEVYTDQYGVDNLALSALGSLVVGSGTANTKLGLFAGQTGTVRNSTFYTQYAPIVRGDNGGITTTSVSDVSVSVNGVDVVPSSIDGATGAISLPFAPVVGASVVATYHYNQFRDQYDYIPARGVNEVTRVSEVPTGGAPASLFTEGESWVLKDDKILWGTASLVSEVADSTFLPSRVSASLVDNRVFLAECQPHAVNGRLSSSVFQLPYVPVDGSGSALPTSRTDVVQVKVGYSLSDAMERNDVSVVRVNPSDSTITLARPVSAGQKVFATFYYSVLQEATTDRGSEYSLSVVTPDRSGVGTYSVTRNGASLYGATYESKGTDLTAITMEFPSGSELRSDAQVIGGVPVDENVTVQIENHTGMPAVYVTRGFGPYNIGKTDAELDLKIDNNVITAFEMDKSIAIPMVVGTPLPYLGSTNETDLGSISGSLLLEVDGQALSVDVANGSADVSHFVSAINTASLSVNPSYTAMASLRATNTVVAGQKDKLTVRYVGDASGITSVDVTMPPANYTPSEFAETLEDQLLIGFDGVLSTLANGDPDDNGSSTNLKVTVDGQDRLVFTLEAVKANDTYGYIEFVTNGLEDFIGVDASVAGSRQSKWGFLPVADFVSTDVGGGSLRDRLILKSRFVVGENYYPPATVGIEVIGGDILTEGGLFAGLSCEGRSLAHSSHISMPIQLLEGELDPNSTLFGVTFHNGSGAEEANNVLSVRVNGTIRNITLEAVDNTFVNAVAVDIANEIDGAIGTTSVVAGDRIYTRLAPSINASIEVLDGSANAVLGLTEGDIFVSELVSTENFVSALNSHVLQANGNHERILFSTDLKTQSATVAAIDAFTEHGIAFVEQDIAGRKFVGFESLSVGVGSVIEFLTSDLVDEFGSGLKIEATDVSRGEDPYQGFVVTSDNANGSGSANSSVISANGQGQDGVIGQTYVDSVTGFSFTLLGRAGGLEYPTGANATLTFKVSKTLTANNTYSVNVIGGVDLLVSNTTGMTVGDKVSVETFQAGGREPSIGQPYYMDIIRQKSAFGTAVFTRISDVVAEFGSIAPENTLSMGAYFAFLNGASAVALHQVPLAEGEIELTTQQVLDAIQAVEGEIVPDLLPSLIVPLVPANDQILTELARHCDIQSSLRYRAERTAIVGFSAGTQPAEARRMAGITRSSRVRLIYPDIASTTITNTFGVSQTYLLDGRYLAVAVACATTAGTIDVATPWTNLQVVGFNALSRNLDAVDANQTANEGVTILHQRGGQILIRHGLTTDMSSILTKTPTVIQIADEVHLRSRDLLQSYIGIKYLPSVISQIEGRVNGLFQALVKEQIIDSFTGLSVTPDPEDPTGLLVECYYKPVFPLLYIQFTFNVRSSIS
jgi:hypothetical protein